MNKSSLMKLKKETLVEMLLGQSSRLSDLCGTGSSDEEPKKEQGVVITLNVGLFAEARPVNNKHGKVMKGRAYVGQATFDAKIGEKEGPAFKNISIFRTGDNIGLGDKFMALTDGFKAVVIKGIEKQIKEGRTIVIDR